MTKKINISRVSLVVAAALFAVVVVASATTSKAHAQVTLDPTTTSMLVTTISATGNLMSTIQGDINAGDFNSTQSAALSGTLGSISSVLASINSTISGIGFPNTGFAPYSASTN